MIQEAIKKIVEREDLSRDDSVTVMTEIMEGKATDAQIASLITALRLKGESVDEISGFAQAMREKAVSIKPKAKVVVDTCGTGGDGTGTFNISTTAAFVVAGAGVTVAKHGNRSVSSHCGSADLLEGLGVRIDIPAEKVRASIDTVGIGFLFAPIMHQAMKYAIGPRKEIGIRTVFNILGPLTNPAQATAQVLGVYAPELTEVMAKVLRSLGVNHALVVHGQGLDEITITGDSRVSELKGGLVENYTIELDCLGITPAAIDDIRCGSLSENVAATEGVLAGVAGPKRDIVLLNAAAALVAADAVDSIKSGIEMAANSIDTGAAAAKLEEMVAFTNS